MLHYHRPGAPSPHRACLVIPVCCLFTCGLPLLPPPPCRCLPAHPPRPLRLLRMPPFPQLEEQLKDRLDAFGDEEAMAAVAAFEAKYKRLKEDYQVRMWGLAGLWGWCIGAPRRPRVLGVCARDLVAQGGLPGAYMWGAIGGWGGCFGGWCLGAQRTLLVLGTWRLKEEHQVRVLGCTDTRTGA